MFSSNTKQRHHEFLASQKKEDFYANHVNVQRKEQLQDFQISRIMDNCLERNYQLDLFEWDEETIKSFVQRSRFDEEDAPQSSELLDENEFYSRLYESVREDEIEEQKHFNSLQ